MTRCIHCTRCVRFGQEVAGMMELGATGRSEWMEIGTYVEKSIDSEMSGNMIDLCPVGALTSKPFRYKVRTWELQAHKSIAAHDSIGSNIFIHTKNNEVKRVVPAENESINEVWISDRDRFSYEAINSEDRLTQPMIKEDGCWKEVDWETALAFTAEGLKTFAKDTSKSAVLASANSTTEELQLLQKLSRAMGIENIDYRLRQVNFESDKTGFQTPILQESIADVEKLDAVLLIGSYLRKELPILNHRLRKASLKGADIAAINTERLKFNYDINDLSSDRGLVSQLASVAKACADLKNDQAAFLNGVEYSEEHSLLAKQLDEAVLSSVMMGQIAQNHPDYSVIQRLGSSIAKNTGASFNILPIQANEVGAHLVDFLPLRGMSAGEIFGSDISALITLGVELDKDTQNSEQATQMARNAGFVVNMTAFDSEAQREFSNVMLPIATFAETAGTFVNINGVKQSFKMACEPKGEAKAAWKILRVLGNMLGLDGFEQTHSNEVLAEVLDNSPSKVAFGVMDAVLPSENNDDGVVLVSPYQMDAYVRRSSALQKTPDADVSTMGRG
jgi:NADH-quinone oxidoreductase subunit G